MNKFKVGDKVVREFTSDFLTVGSTYTILGTDGCSNVEVKDSAGNHFSNQWFDERCFRLLESAALSETLSKGETKVDTLTPSLVVYKQEPHCCGNQDEEATAKFYLEDGGEGEYLVIDVKQWSFDKPEEIDEFCAKMKLQLSFANKESTIG